MKYLPLDVQQQSINQLILEDINRIDKQNKYKMMPT
jgi:hypothetical protein